jgi:trimeric autotransporter adhesin
VTLNGTINYRRNDGDRLNVFPLLNGQTLGSALSVPITLTARHGRTTQTINANFNQVKSSTLNAFAFNSDVAQLAGINGVSTDPFDWGVPTLTFGSYTSLRDIAPARRIDRSLQLGYTLLHSRGAHNYRLGGSYLRSTDRTQSDTNANGSFTFTGLYTTDGRQATRVGSGQDFADFLLGLPQQATRQYSLTSGTISAPVDIRGDQFSLFIQDDWRWKPRWTLNYGLQYDFVTPFREANGHMVNLDAAPDFVAVAPVQPGEDGPYSGEFPSALVKADGNNVAPRVGLAWRATNRTVVRFGYGLAYNSGTYSNIARQLYQQPPFFVTGTSIGSLAAPLTITDAFGNIAPSTVTNNYGIDKNYKLGMIHQWTADYSRDLLRSWNAGVTYFGTLGRALDLLRAPNRGPTGLRIPDVQSFIWQSSDGASHANGVSVRLQKRQTRGISGNVTYTLSKSMDDTTATSGNATVAQDDQNLAAEWAPSNFDQRHQFAGTLGLQLPWGVNRPWLNQGGVLAAIVGGWSVNANLTWNSGTPLTVRCSTCASDVARGTGGTLRASYLGLPIDVSDPTIDQFFNTRAFAIPPAGLYGNSLRNMIVGPGSHQLNASFSRDIQVSRTRAVTIQASATNLLNTVNYAAVDVNVNSPTFGDVLSVRGMRTIRLNMRFRF